MRAAADAASRSSAFADIACCFNYRAIGAGSTDPEGLRPFDQHTLQLGRFLQM
jgi:hypothetical protein